jgi:hypothetical protein
VWGEVHTRFWLGNIREGDYLEDPRIILKWIYEK